MKKCDKNFYPSRKRPVHGVHSSPHTPTIVFVTVCTKNREPWLASDSISSLLHNIWFEANAWWVGKYIIMPDHVHLFASPGEKDISLANWIKFWKSQFTQKHRDRRHIWQSGYWDTRLRTFENYGKKWEYVKKNPVRHGLVNCEKDWPFQGEIHKLQW